ncbi:MAG: FAD-dependent oxidoreductase [Candidatus Aenigmarchaeota archaeon]|nr:FAD-dependent oxidoreductase [Candidatus Aenigmarchaeota archaeon]
MAKTDILIIGGGPAGVVAAVTARKNNPSKKIALVRETEKAVIPCGIPYIFNRLDSAEKNIMPDNGLEANKIDILIDKAVKIDKTAKTVDLKSGKNISYDKLILAVGSKPITIPIDGIDKKGVWRVEKDLEYLKKLRQEVLKSKNIVILGGGFIGVEIAEELININGLNISLVEKLDNCLITTLDKEFAVEAEEKLKQKGVKLYTNCSVNQITGKNRVEYVKLDNGKTIPADIVILAIGARPNIDLTKEPGIKLGDYNGIRVDEYMRTNVPDIFAIGDCAETRDFFTGKHIPIMLASTATTKARIVAANLYQLNDLRETKGTLSSFSTCIDGLVLGGTGITENRAKKEGFDILLGTSQCPNHHPGTLPNTGSIKVKLIFSKTSKALLGAQISGPESISEMINILALAIQNELTVYDFQTMQFSTHPLLTTAPTVYPLITAAQSALAKLD